ncbi:hypothetical protein FHL15_010118 [Xylaria flabelliformis]|uniref:Uncharacterized protein n=1 Tax=Xylaria flabelliformis TaxID=2512241 RepID=A0A553HM61_9PEZI|nr:hypothetical protein FHL15_010118 [Xylaria flabelliformis]
MSAIPSGLDEESTDKNTKAYELRLWPSPYLQAYCLDHFLLECKTYHEQENERYNKLVSYSRNGFLARKIKEEESNKPVRAPTRRQPTRQAKEKHSVLDMTPPPTPQMISHLPSKPEKPSDTPLKPARLEKEFKESPEGAMFRVLSQLRKRLELHKGWEDYRRPLEAKIGEKTRELRAKMESGKYAHKDYIFSEPLGVDCRYCGFTDTVLDDGATTPRKLAMPAPMHMTTKASNTAESEIAFRGTNLVVDVCGEKTMIILVGFKGVLDLCAELLAEEEALPDSPTSLSIRLGNSKLRLEDLKIAGAKRGGQ